MKYKLASIAGLLLLVAFSIMTVLRSRHLGSDIRHPVLDAPRSGAARSTIGTPLDLHQLTNAASIILVGKVADLTPAGIDPQSRSDFRMSVSVNKVLKGSVSGSNVTIDFTRDPSRLAFTKTVTPLMFGILFLNPRPTGSYGLAESKVEALVAVAGGADTKASADQMKAKADALDGVINELGNVLASFTSSDEEKIQAIRALAPIDSKPANDALRRTVPREGNVKLQADAGLLRHNDISTLKEIEGLLLDRNFKGSLAVPAIAAAIRDGVRSSDSVPILIHLASAPDAQIRRGAVHALREIGSPIAWNAFAQALDDSDQMVRYDAVLGLSELTGDTTHAPSVDTFKRGEKEYVTYWKQHPK